MTIDLAHWQQRLDLLADKRGMAGAQLGILLDGEVRVAVTGSANLRERIEATTDTLFQVGSITKVWTATMIMQLVDEGRVDLDTPVVDYLPGVTLRDPAVTIRHLLTHTSGIDGDHFLDTGTSDDCLEKYVASLSEVAQNHPVGATMSYSNAGYSLLGRLLEVLDGKVFDVLLRDRLTIPLGLARTWTRPEDVIRYRNALGHVRPTPDSELTGSPTWGLYRSSAPAGAITQPVSELLEFARLHLAGGVAPDGTHIVSAESVAAMQVPQVEVPDQFTLGQHWGLGWILTEWDGRKIYGHDGTTLGQNAYLKVVPDRGLAIALLTNGGSPADLYRDLFTELLSELAGIEMPPALGPTDFEADPTAYLGTYERAGSRIEVSRAKDGLEISITATGPIAAAMPNPTTTMQMKPHSPGTFVVQRPGSDAWVAAVFYDVPGAGMYVHAGARATPKTS